jgi:predicted transcriptional regulator
MSDQNISPEGQMNIELSEQVAEGIYSNLAIISHSNSEFIVDFIQILPGLPKAKVKSRIILTPQHAKRLVQALKDNIRKFEDQFGSIEETEGMKIPMNFGGPAAQA